MKFPYATTLLVLVATAIYVFQSGGTYYMTNEAIQELSFQISHNPLGIVSHMFAHVGIIHLVGNLIPLILFGLVVEYALCSVDVLLIFFSSGIIASTLFSVLNANTILLGASAAISGLMSSSALLKPKKAIVLLLFTPLLVSYAAIPAFDYLSTSHTKELLIQTKSLEQNVSTLLKENKTEEAKQLNQTLQEVQKKTAISLVGRAREESTPTDWLVHAFGAVVGAAYLFLFRKRALGKGINEMERLGIGFEEFIEKHWANKLGKHAKRKK